MIPFSNRGILRGAHENTTRTQTQTRAAFETVCIVSAVPRWRSWSSQAQTLPVIAASLYAIAPVAMLQVPPNGLPQTALERVPRRPPQLPADLARVDRVSPVVTGTIRDERLQPAAAVWGRAHLVHEIADAVHNLEVRALVAAADIVLLARTTVGQRDQQAGAVILDVQPVADVTAVAVDRKRPLVDRVEDHQRDQLLGKLVRPVVVGAVH